VRRKLYLTLSELNEAVAVQTELVWLYKAYAQNKLLEAGIHIDLDTLCGYPRPPDGLG